MQGVEFMSKVIEDMLNKVTAEVTRKYVKEVAVRLLEVGDSYEKIARVTKLSVEEVKELDKFKTA